MLVPGLSLISEDSSATDRHLAQSDDISVSPSMSDIELRAGETVKVYLDIHNLFPKGSDDDPNTLIVYVHYTGKDSDINVTFPNGYRVEVDGEELGYCEVDIEVWKYARSTEHEISFDIYINDPDRGFPIRADASDTVRISVHSDLSSENYYNKIMGIWDNNLPSPLDGPLFTTIISFAIWLLIAIVIAYFLIPIVLDKLKIEGFSKHNKKEGGS